MKLFNKVIDAQGKESYVEVEAYTKDELTTELENIKSEVMEVKKQSPNEVLELRKQLETTKQKLDDIERQKDLEIIKQFNVKQDLAGEFYDTYKKDFAKCTSKQELDLLLNKISVEKPSYFSNDISIKKQEQENKKYDEFLNFDKTSNSFSF
jgi:hypothetical protein